MRTLSNQLDDACRQYGLQWVVLPFERDAWSEGPFWSVLVREEAATIPGSRAYAYNDDGRMPGEARRDPEVVFINTSPQGRKEAMRLLLAQLD